MTTISMTNLALVKLGICSQIIDHENPAKDLITRISLSVTDNGLFCFVRIPDKVFSVELKQKELNKVEDPLEFTSQVYIEFAKKILSSVTNPKNTAFHIKSTGAQSVLQKMISINDLELQQFSNSLGLQNVKLISPYLVAEGSNLDLQRIETALLDFQMKTIAKAFLSHRNREGYSKELLLKYLSSFQNLLPKNTPRPLEIPNQITNEFKNSAYPNDITSVAKKFFNL